MEVYETEGGLVEVAQVDETGDDVVVERSQTRVVQGSVGSIHQLVTGVLSHILV